MLDIHDTSNFPTDDPVYATTNKDELYGIVLCSAERFFHYIYLNSLLFSSIYIFKWIYAYLNQFACS